MGVRDTVFYDPHTFRKHFKNIGRAYREQATTLIEICRLYAEASPQTYTEDDRLQNIFRFADAALSAAGKAKKGRTPQAADAFLCVRDEIIRFGSPPPRRETPGDYRKRLPNPSAALANAAKKDEKTTTFLSKVKSAFNAPLPSGSVKNVNFVILESPYERRKDQLIVNQEIDNSTTISEIIWRFSRYPEGSDRRIAARQNPHFYLGLSKDAASYGNKFHKDSLQDEFGHGLEKGGTVYVLVDKSCRLFLDAAKPYIPRIFGNLWKPHQSVILKDVGGVLESDDIVLSKIGKSQDYWYRPSITDSSQRRTYSKDASEIVKKPVGNWRALLDAALSSQNVDLMIRDRSKPVPPEDSDWKPLPSPEPSSAGVPVLEEQTTPRQFTPHLPQLEYSTTNTGDSSSIGSSTLSPSTESFETAFNTSEVSLPPHAATGRGLQSVHRGISHAISRQSAIIRLPQPETEVNVSEVSTQPAVAIRPQSVDRGISHVTSRQPPVLLPQPEYSVPNTIVSSICGSTLFPSIESFETLVNTSEVPPLTRAPAAKRPSPQSVDSGLNQATSRQLIALQPLQEPSNPEITVHRICGNTLSPPSSESLETLVNTSEVSLPTPVAASKSPYSVDSGIVDQTTPRPSITRLPQVEFTNPNTSVPTLGGNTLFANSANSFEMLVNTSEVSFPTTPAPGKRPQSVDSGIDLQVEVPTPDTPSTPPTSAPPTSLLVTIPSPPPAQSQELQSAPPVRKWETHGNWFKKYKYDYETESWIPRES